MVFILVIKKYNQLLIINKKKNNNYFPLSALYLLFDSMLIPRQFYQFSYQFFCNQYYYLLFIAAVNYCRFAYFLQNNY